MSLIITHSLMVDPDNRVCPLTTHCCVLSPPAGISWTDATMRACRSPMCAPSICHHVLRNIRRNGLCRSYVHGLTAPLCGFPCGSGLRLLCSVPVQTRWSTFYMPVQLTPFPRLSTSSPPSVCTVCLHACLSFCGPRRVNVSLTLSLTLWIFLWLRGNGRTWS